jgi:putative copper export protein/mono/diheme cytochrome c family protein
MSAIDIVASLLRGVHVAALVSLFGTLLFTAVVLPAGSDCIPVRQTLHRLARLSALVGLIAGVTWLVVQTAAIADADGAAMALRAVPTVALHTQFGQWLALRLVLLAGVLVLYRIGLGIPIALAGIALAVQPLLGHAGAIGGGTGAELIASEALHLLAAGAWLGGLLPLFLSVSRLSHDAAAAACRSFTPIGLASVLLLAGTAVVQVGALMGGLPGLFGTGYGQVALAKLGLFVVLLTLAALNRLVLTDRLAAGSGTRLAMRLSVAAEMGLGALVVLTAGFLASRTPGTHEQPVWPFSWRLSAWAFSDPDFRAEVIVALIAAIVGIAVMLAGLAWCRIRWIAFGAGAIAVAAAIPHLDLLFVAAYPTSFYTSPTEFAATAIAHGARLFATNCVACHGVEGRGDGPAAKSLAIPPADLTAAHFRAHSDGELYWFISHGFTTPEGAPAMPGFAGVVSSEGIWDLIDYLHAHNAGETLRQTGSWPQPLPMPQFDAQCANGEIIDLDDLRGRVLRIVAASDDERADPVLPDDVDVATVLVPHTIAARPVGAACVASEPQVWTALAIIVGSSPDALAGAQVLVDRNGWLRAAWRPGDAEDWTDVRVLATRLRDIIAHPLVVNSPGAHAHRH